MNRLDIKSMSFDELKTQLEKFSQPTYRTEQIYSWLHKKCVISFDEMQNIPKALRSLLSENFEIYGCSVERKLVSDIDGTVKFLFRLHDDEFVESVVMKYKYGYTICISTQVGCKMGCAFCASALGGFKRSLMPSEMLGQIHTASRDMNIRISHIVLMGMGEPLDNYENVVKFLRLISDDKGLNIGMRNISLSTCGLVDNIYRLINEKLQLTLSISLHAPNDQIRSRIMPVNNKYSVDELLTACKKYSKETSRRISFEYSLINGINDSDECAVQLSHKLKGILCHVNLIPINVVKERGYFPPSRERIEKFSDILEKNGITVTVRRSLGSDINASCGQLRRTQISSKVNED